MRFGLDGNDSRRKISVAPHIQWMSGIAFHLFAEARDEGVGIAQHDDLPAAEHGKATQLIEDIGQFSPFTVQIGSLRIRRQQRKNFPQLLKLNERVATDQGIHRLARHRCAFVCPDIFSVNEPESVFFRYRQNRLHFIGP